MSRTSNLLSVDLEEWFVVEVLQSRFSSDNWASLPSTLERNTLPLLDLFDTHDTRATFFILGWCADRFPALMKEIARRGHEVACHSYWHRRVDRLKPEQFREDTLLAIGAIEKATGRRPRGYRAPSWSISDKTPWAFDILAELGFDYDSSIFPIKHDLYGVPHGPRKPVKISTSVGKSIQEIPASTVRLFGQNLPVTGGGYFRHAPLWYSRALVKKLNQENLPANVYLHPWEFDPNPPQVSNLSLLARIRGGAGTDILSLKLDRLLRDGEFITLSEYTQELSRTSIGFERRSTSAT